MTGANLGKFVDIFVAREAAKGARMRSCVYLLEYLVCWDCKRLSRGGHILEIPADGVAVRCRL